MENTALEELLQKKTPDILWLEEDFQTKAFAPVTPEVLTRMTYAIAAVKSLVRENEFDTPELISGLKAYQLILASECMPPSVEVILTIGWISSVTKVLQNQT